MTSSFSFIRRIGLFERLTHGQGRDRRKRIELLIAALDQPPDKTRPRNLPIPHILEAELPLISFRRINLSSEEI